MVCYATQELYESDPLQASITNIESVIDHPRLPRTVIAMRRQSIYVINETSCLTLAANESPRCTAHPDIIQNVEAKEWRRIVHVPVVSMDSFAIFDYSHDCILHYDMLNQIINDVGWIGKCRSSGKVYGSFEQTRLNNIESPVYDHRTDILYFATHQTDVVSCNVTERTCEKVDTPIYDTHAHIILSDSFLFVFLQDCRMYLRNNHDDDATFTSYAFGSIAGSCDPQNVVSYGEDLYDFSTDTIYHIEFDHEDKTFTYSEALIISETQQVPFSTPHPDKSIKSVTQSGPHTAYYTTESNSQTLFYRVYTPLPETTTSTPYVTTTNTKMPQERHSNVTYSCSLIPVQETVCQDSLLISILNSIDSDINCAYTCLKSTWCTCIWYNNDLSTCELRNCASHDLELVSSPLSECLLLKPVWEM